MPRNAKTDSPPAKLLSTILPETSTAEIAAATMVSQPFVATEALEKARRVAVPDIDTGLCFSRLFLCTV